MPMMDGIEAAEIIRRDCGENGAAPAIIALTANAMEGMRERFLDKGFQDFIAKPLDRRELGRLLVRWVPEERRRPAAPPEQPAPAADLSAFRIEGIDPDAAARYSNGDAAAFAELLELYAMDGRRKLPLLTELVRSDLAAYCVEVHGLKSASANIGATELSDLARAHENAANREDRAFIDRNFPALTQAYEALLENIRSFLDRQGREDVPEKLPALPEEELAGRTDAALRALEDFRSKECARIVAELLSHRLPRDAEDALKEIQSQLMLFEDDNAEALLRQLLRKLKKEDGANV